MLTARSTFQRDTLDKVTENIAYSEPIEMLIIEIKPARIFLIIGVAIKFPRKGELYIFLSGSLERCC